MACLNGLVDLLSVVILRHRLSYVLGLMIVSACASRVSAEPIVLPAVNGGSDLDFCGLPTLLPDDGAEDDWFGRSVAVSGDVVLVGAEQDDDNGTDSGSAYVFRWNGSTWIQEQKLLPDDGNRDDRFGCSVSLSGNRALVAACRDGDNGTNSGAAYVFRWNGTTWVQEQKLVANDGEPNDWFGYIVSLSGNLALLGAPLDDDNGIESGSAYVFRWNGTAWIQEHKLLPDDGARNDRFGFYVSVSGEVALVGAWGNDDNETESGSAYVFRWNGTAWIQEQKLLPDDGEHNDLFGISVSVSGDAALVGAEGDDDNGTNSGAAYVFRWNGTAWVQEQKLLADDGAAWDKFGRWLSLSGDVALVGAFSDDVVGQASGSAHVFRWNGKAWVREQKLLPPDGADRDWFGSPVSISGDVALIGASRNDDNGTNSGSAYVYFTGPPKTIGGAIYTDCNTRLTSGEEGIEVTVSGPNGVFTAVTSGRSGLWNIPDVPCGEYVVAPSDLFREYCRVELGGDCPPQSCETSAQITVDAEHRAENLSIQFLGRRACIINDLNDDGVCTITFDTELFLQCVYDDDCVGPEGQDLRCSADCNCDGLATIVFDASCFMHDVYVKGVCGECPDAGRADDTRRPERPPTASGFTIGGAVYEDTANPLLSGIEGVNVQVFGAGRKIAATATTAGPSGIWRVDDLLPGKYTIVFEQRDGRASNERDVIPIVVNGDNEAANLSIRLLMSRESSRLGWKSTLP